MAHAHAIHSMKRKTTLLLTVPIAITAVLAGRWYRDTYIPVKEPLASIPDPVKAGDVNYTIARMKRLIGLLKEVDWNPLKVSESDRYLPDVKYYHEPEYYRDGIVPISFLHLPGWKPIPEYENVAFYSDLYVRFNTKIFKGDKVTHSPSGFWLVGWKNGDVTSVDPKDIRWIKSKVGRRILSFPGMPGYDPKEGMLDPKVRFARGGSDEEKKEFFKKLSEGSPDPECASCAK